MSITSSTSTSRPNDSPVETVCDGGSTSTSAGTGVAVDVTDGVGVSVGVSVSVGVAVSVAVAVAEGVAVSVAVGSGVCVSVAVGSGVGVSVAVGSGVGVSVGTGVSVAVAVSVAVSVGVAVAVGAATVTLPPSGGCAVRSTSATSRSSSAGMSIALVPLVCASKTNDVSTPAPSAPGSVPLVVQITVTVPVPTAGGSQITVRPFEPRNPLSIAPSKARIASSNVTV
jgi:hypothetical protein